MVPPVCTGGDPASSSRDRNFRPYARCRGVIPFAGGNGINHTSSGEDPRLLPRGHVREEIGYCTNSLTLQVAGSAERVVSAILGREHRTLWDIPLTKFRHIGFTHGVQDCHRRVPLQSDFQPITSTWTLAKKASGCSPHSRMSCLRWSTDVLSAHLLSMMNLPKGPSSRDSVIRAWERTD